VNTPRRAVELLVSVAAEVRLDLSGFPAPPAWTSDALCAETDPEAFFPEKGGSTREGVAMCHRCTVAAECLDYAIANNERFGIWGGLTERNRRSIRLASKEPAA